MKKGKMNSQELTKFHPENCSSEKKNGENQGN